MPQNDADRIARQRAQQQQDQEAVAQRAKEAQARATQQSLIQQIEAEIPIIPSPAGSLYVGSVPEPEGSGEWVRKFAGAFTLRPASV